VHAIVYTLIRDGYEAVISPVITILDSLTMWYTMGHSNRLKRLCLHTRILSLSLRN